MCARLQDDEKTNANKIQGVDEHFKTRSTPRRCVTARTKKGDVKGVLQERAARG